MNASLKLSSLVVASGNPGKLREFDRLLKPLGVQVSSQSEFGVEPADEPYDTFVENALAKARHASAKTGLPALADDSGICVPVLGGAPGVRSARYADPVQGVEQDLLNNNKLIQALAGMDDRRAFYVAVLVLVMRADDPLPVIAQGLWAGEVSDKPRGSNGFGYDPHFWLPELGATAAQLDPVQKNQVSHRGQAMQSLIDQVAKRGLLGTSS
ncbi:MAG: RdgB/HAM1 family non-canonical purine NTP pyrophosphatase [Burkholderiaceae bacterium]|nr:RdgB/HAM1 family non-canonical purine NTP pyrophosphatase [Burkholderiaceae bacterium]MCD8516286.1 RdgB/HAM1 family non-canonical purine NTP pyrophosphatase [Burkholderiaceae bacterium]MCD8566311.1 RdgB/HAM1 family non-canonical purine NTP pyrophosphatase [Burkholderiaceae bacterium]